MFNPFDVATFLDSMRQSAGWGLTIVFGFMVLGPLWFSPINCDPALFQEPTIANPDPQPAVDCKNVFGATFARVTEADLGEITRNAIISMVIGVAIWAAIAVYKASTTGSITANPE